MREVRIAPTKVNALLVLLVKPKTALFLHSNYAGHLIYLNLMVFIESQCRSNILSSYCNVEQGLFDTGRKFVHAVFEQTEYCNMRGVQADFKQLYIAFKEKLAFLNLFFISHFEDPIRIEGTIPLCVKDFVQQHQGVASSKAQLCIPTSEFITAVPDTLAIRDYLLQNEEALKHIFQYILRYSGQLRYLIDARKCLHELQVAKNPKVISDFIDLYFCMHNEAIMEVS